MNLNRDTMKKIMGLIAFAILLYVGLQNTRLVSAALRYVVGLTAPFLIGGCIAFVLNVPMRALEKKFWPETDKKALNALRRPMCILVSLVLILAILTAVVMLVVPELVNAFGVLADQIPVFLKNAQAWLLANGDAFPALQDWLSAAQIDWNSIGQTLLGYVTTGAGNLLGGTVHVVTGIAGGATNTIIAFIFALYILLGKEKFKHQLIVLGQAFLPQRACNALAHVGKVAARTFAKFVSGQCIEACILGTLCWLGMLLFRFPYAPMVGALVGISALVPIVGYNYGARKKQRITDAVRVATVMALAIMAAGTLVFELGAGPLLGLFNASPAMHAMGEPAFRIIALSFLPAAVGIVMSSVFQALGEGLISLVMSATRQLVFLLPLAFLLAKFSGLAAVWASIPLAEVVGFALALLFYRHIYNHKIAHIETVQFD